MKDSLATGQGFEIEILSYGCKSDEDGPVNIIGPDTEKTEKADLSQNILASNHGPLRLSFQSKVRPKATIEQTTTTVSLIGVTCLRQA